MRLEGWHIIVMLGFVLVLAVLVGIVLVVAARRRAGARVPTGSRSGSPDGLGGGSVGKEHRLRELDELLRREVIGEDEYRTARARILDS